MSELTIVCDNCGAKYRLPASFSGDKAKCKQCGSVIDVAAQRAGSSAAPKPAPAAKAAPVAKAAPAAAERPRRAARQEQPAATEGKSRRGERAKKSDDAGEASSGRGKRAERGEREPKKSNAMLLVGGGVGALAIVAVIVVLSTSGKKDAPEQQQQAQAPAAAKPEQPAATPAPAAATPAAPVDDKTPAANPAPTPTSEKTPEATKGAAPAGQPADAPKATDAAAKAAGSGAAAATADGEHKEAWERNKTTSLADVFDPKTLGDVSWPSDIADDKKAEIRALISDIVDGGRASIVAKPKVEKLGYDAIFGVVERLRQLDYKSSEEMMTGWELNKLLEAICAGMNTGYAAVQVGEDVDPRKADHNAKTNKAWAQLLTKFPTKDAFNSWRTDRLQKGLDKAK